MASPHVASSRLVEYLIFVGPEQKDEITGYCEISEGTVLRQFPKHCHKDCPLSSRVANFCQPQCEYEIDDEIHSHIFTMIDMETNQKLYGVCNTFPYEVHSSSHDPDVAKETVPLSVCILSQQLFFKFFQRCLKTLTNMVDSCCDTITWIDLFNRSDTANSATATLVSDIEKWIETLLTISAPNDPSVLLEVTLDISSPTILRYPPSHELPLCELSVRQLFQHLRPHTVNEIIRLILTEQKVLIYSRKCSVVSDVVLTLIVLLYPLEYVYPVIPLLPSRLSEAADFLMVPVPYIIGTTADLISKLSPANLEEVYVVDIDNKKIQKPDNAELLPQLPLNSCELQANIKKVLDNLQPISYVEDSLIIVDYQDVEKVDVLIRHAFLRFMVSPQMLGLLPRHQTIVRLFPRPIITSQLSTLLQEYSLHHKDDDFIKKLMASQSIECFLAWNLNPTNTAYLSSGRSMTNGDLDHQQSVTSTPNKQQQKVSVHLCDPKSNLYQHLINAHTCQDYSSDEDLKAFHIDDCIFPPNMATTFNSRPRNPLSLTTTTAMVSAADQTCQQWVEKLLGGRGVPFFKAQHKQLLASDSHRAEMLLLVERGLLGCKESTEVLQNISPMEVGRPVYRKLLDLFKMMIKAIDNDFYKSPHASLVSAFILLRLSCLVCTTHSGPPTPASSLSKSFLYATTQSDYFEEQKLPESPKSLKEDTDIELSIASTISTPDKSAELDISDSSPNKPHHTGRKYLCHDLFMKSGQPSTAGCFADNQFWKTIFASTVSLLRDKLGWNEKTPELYQRYLSSSHSVQQKMESDEIEILMPVLTNLAIFLQVTGVNPDKSKQLVNSISTHSRLGMCSDFITSICEGKWRWDEAMNSKEIRLNVKKSVSFGVHLGANKIGTTCTAEVWDEMFVVRRVSDGKIIQHMWVDAIETTSCDIKNELVVFHFVDKTSPPLLLCSQQCQQIHETIRKNVTEMPC